jgi:hypothetical protein
MLAQCAEQAMNTASRSGKWRYTVARCTPASAAMPEIVVRAGPTVPWSLTAASVMWRRVSASCSARRRFRYTRGGGAVISLAMAVQWILTHFSDMCRFIAHRCSTICNEEVLTWKRARPGH